MLVVLALGDLGFTGLGIDVIRHHLTPTAVRRSLAAAAGRRPHWPPLGLVGLISVDDFRLCALRAWHAAVSRPPSRSRSWCCGSSSQLRTDVYDKLQRLSFRFFDANPVGSIINRVAGDVQADADVRRRRDHRSADGARCRWPSIWPTCSAFTFG